VSWTVYVPEGNGHRPFNAIGMFVRLLSRTGAPATIGFASATAHPDGRYAGDVSVPEGGIGGIRMGLRGTTDISFPLENDSFTCTASCPDGQPWAGPVDARRRLVAELRHDPSLALIPLS